MALEQLPNRMAGYATYELALLMAELSPRQRAAIDRIVQHVYVLNRPMAELLRGDDKICSEQSYYGRPRIDPATGDVLDKGGWSNQPLFQRALAEAARLALQTHDRERRERIERAKRRAEDKALSAVNVYVGIMEDPEQFNMARIQAADKLLGLAFKGTDGEPQTAGDAEAEWWQAAGHEPA